MMNREARRAILAGIIGAGLISPAEAKAVMFIPQAPAIIKPAGFWKPHEKKLELGMPITLGMLKRSQLATVTSYNGGNAAPTIVTTTVTWTAAPIGTASANRYVVVCVLARLPSATLNSLTIGGTTATILLQRSVTNESPAIAILLVTTGTTADIIATYSGNPARATMLSMSIINLVSTTPVGTISTGSVADPSGTVNVNAGGCIIAIANTDNSTTGTTWTGVTEDYDAVQGGAELVSGGHLDYASAVTPQTVTADFVSAGSSTNLLAVSMR